MYSICNNDNCMHTFRPILMHFDQVKVLKGRRNRYTPGGPTRRLILQWFRMTKSVENRYKSRHNIDEFKKTSNILPLVLAHPFCLHDYIFCWSRYDGSHWSIVTVSHAPLLQRTATISNRPTPTQPLGVAHSAAALC